MFEIGEYVVYGNTGICKIEDITTLDMPGANSDRLYYVMSSVRNNGNRVFLPVDNTKVVLRAVMNEEAVNELLGRIDEIPEIQADNDKVREERYKEFSKGCDCENWVAIIKTVASRKKERMAQGKKITATDERYSRMAGEHLYSELSFVLGKEISDIETLINDKIT